MDRFQNSTLSVHTDTSFWRFWENLPIIGRFTPTTLDRYIFIEIFAPFIVALLFWTSLFMTVVLRDVLGELIGKGIPFFKVMEYLVYLLAEKVTETIPMACLFSGILAAGRLSGESEIVAMRSAGISYPRIYAVFIFFGFLASIVVAAMNLYLGPMGSKAREDFEDWLKAYHSFTLVQPGKFLGAGNMDGVSRSGQDIYADTRVGDTLHEVQIREWFNGLDEKNSEKIFVRNISIPIGDGFITQILHAQTGELLSRLRQDGKEEKLLRLRNGFVIDVDQKQQQYQITDFSNGFMDYVIPPPVKPLGRLNVRPENYTYPELFDFLDRMEKGGTEISVDAIAGGSVKAGATGDGATFKLPPVTEMHTMLQQMQLWLLTNQAKIGKEGGPTAEEAQQKVQLMLQLSVFLQDAERTQNRFEVEIQRRIATPVICMLFFFVSFPLGLVVKRSGRGMSFTQALIVFALYYFFLTVGLAQGYKGAMHPFWAAWLADFVILLFGMVTMASRTEGFSRYRNKLPALPTDKIIAFFSRFRRNDPAELP